MIPLIQALMGILIRGTRAPVKDFLWKGGTSQFFFGLGFGVWGLGLGVWGLGLGDKVSGLALNHKAAVGYTRKSPQT